MNSLWLKQSTWLWIGHSGSCRLWIGHSGSCRLWIGHSGSCRLWIGHSGSCWVWTMLHTTADASQKWWWCWCSFRTRWTLWHMWRKTTSTVERATSLNVEAVLRKMLSLQSVKHSSCASRATWHREQCRWLYQAGMSSLSFKPFVNTLLETVNVVIVVVWKNFPTQRKPRGVFIAIIWFRQNGYQTTVLCTGRLHSCWS